MTPIVQTYLGLYRAEGDGSQEYYVFKSSPLNQGDKTLQDSSLPNPADDGLQQLAPDRAVDDAQKWFGAKLMRALYKTLDRGLELWKTLGPRGYCLHEQVDGV